MLKECPFHAVFFLSMTLLLMWSGGEPGWEGQNHLGPNQDWAQPAGWQPRAGDQAARAQVRWIYSRSSGRKGGAKVRDLKLSSSRRSSGQTAGAQVFRQLGLKSLGSWSSGQAARAQVTAGAQVTAVAQVRELEHMSGTLNSDQAAKVQPSSWSSGLAALPKVKQLELRSSGRKISGQVGSSSGLAED